MRAATGGDLPALTELYRRWDTARFGAPEHDADEVRETLGEGPIENRSRLLFDDGRLVAAAWFWSAETTLLVDPDTDPAPYYAELVPWLEAQRVPLDALASDPVLRSVLETRGWAHERSSFELIRPVSADWTPAEPVWPDGIAVSDLRDADLAEVHRLIYVDAGWAEVPGHPDRPFQQWREIFVTDKEDPAQQVLARRESRLVGVAMGRIFSDGAGWVSQLAVARNDRRHGLGRALLLESFRRRLAAGASLLGLSVEGVNRDAIGLYLDVGLTIDREWQRFLPPA